MSSPSQIAGSAQAITPPLVGRSRELAALTELLNDAAAGAGRTVILAGEGGVGKTRLAKALTDLAAKRGWLVTTGRAYPAESGVPYALFSDASLPIQRRLEPSSLQVLTRGGAPDLWQLFPALVPHGEQGRQSVRGDSADFKARVFYTFAQFLSRFSAKEPFVAVLENLQWADAASLELLHFVARQAGKDKYLLLCTYNDAERDANPVLRATEQSLVSLGAAALMPLAPLTRAETEELVRGAFAVDAATVKEFVALLYGWTRGNPFFVEETLKALVEAGTLRWQHGRWTGWETGEFKLPRSVRDAVATRLSRLSPAARSVANSAAVIGARATYEVLLEVSGLTENDLIAALDELRTQRILVEDAEGDRLHFDFAHPLLQETLYAELGRARTRRMHATVAEALEKHYGRRAIEHAAELAAHFGRADVGTAPQKAVRYLAAAGRAALARHADREAAGFLASALELTDRGLLAEDEVDHKLVEDLAHARQRLGEYEAAMALWRRARADAASRDEDARIGAIERRMGLSCYWGGRPDEALAHYEAALAAAKRAGDDRLYALTLLAQGNCLQTTGRQAEAQVAAHGALAVAERLGDDVLLARVHRALLVLYVWSAEARKARETGQRALALAERVEHQGIAWSVHWALAMLAGLTGDGELVRHHLGEAERLAGELRSPLLRVWTAEIAIEYAAGTGRWAEGIDTGERTIALARTLGQRALLPRILVWTGLLYQGRGDLKTAKAYFDEAWSLSGAGGASRRPIDMTTAVPAHTGLAAYHVATGEYERAIEIGEAGLALADRTGYTVWAVHRLLPTVVEALLWKGELDRAEKLNARLRADSRRLGHRLGVAWADTCDALLAMLRGQHDAGIPKLRKAAEDLEAIPWVADASRVRRMLARFLFGLGRKEEAMKELRRVHDEFARLGAERELSITRDAIRELGARPPVRPTGGGLGGLTGRELEIARMVASRKSNKEIGSALGISSRTVSTHLSNIFAKTGVGSRGELTDLVRAQGLADPLPLTNPTGA